MRRRQTANDPCEVIAVPRAPTCAAGAAALSFTGKGGERNVGNAADDVGRTDPPVNEIDGSENRIHQRLRPGISDSRANELAPANLKAAAQPPVTAAHGGKGAAEKHMSVRLNIQIVDVASNDRTIISWTGALIIGRVHETGVERAVGKEPRQIGARRFVVGREEPADDEFAVVLLRDAKHSVVGANARVEGGVQGAIGVESDHAVAAAEIHVVKSAANQDFLDALHGNNGHVITPGCRKQRATLVYHNFDLCGRTRPVTYLHDRNSIGKAGVKDAISLVVNAELIRLAQEVVVDDDRSGIRPRIDQISLLRRGSAGRVGKLNSAANIDEIQIVDFVVDARSGIE